MTTQNKVKQEDDEIFIGSGNVFADMGQPDAEEKLYKSRLVMALGQLMKARGLTQKEAAAIFGEDQSNLSKILRGRLRLITSDRLILWLSKLGADVETKVIFSPRERHGVTVELCTDNDCAACA